MPSRDVDPQIPRQFAHTPAPPPDHPWWHVLLAWAWIGFAGGAAVLLLGAIPFEHWLKARGTTQSTINVALAATALVWVVVSGVVARAATRLAHGRAVWLLHAAGVLASTAVFLMFLQSGHGIIARFQGDTSEVGGRFTFGPYPDAATLRSLKDRGYAGVVTLLSPLVPFEAVLLTEERAAAAAAGLTLVEASMLPWVSENTEPLEIIRKLAASGTERYYIHCYLGRHRAELARSVIERALGTYDATAFAAQMRSRFSRGGLTLAGQWILVGPRPTKDEWFPPLMRAGVRRVIALDTENTALIAEEREWATAYGVRFETYDDPGDGYAGLADDLARATEPVYVHAFRADARIVALLTALERRIPGGVRRLAPPDPVDGLVQHASEGAAAALSLPTAFERGPVTVYDGRIAVGPMPTPGEWEDFVGPGGVRFVISMLDPKRADEAPWIDQERRFADAIGADLVLVPVRRPNAIWPAIRAARKLGSGVYLHGWATEDRVAEARLILSGQGPMPTQIERGPVHTVRDGLYRGPLPTADDWFALLARGGITTAVCLLDPANPEEASWIAQMQEVVTATGGRLLINPPATDPIPGGGRVYVHAFGADDPRVDAYLNGQPR